jgi:hypothetical protein
MDELVVEHLGALKALRGLPQRRIMGMLRDLRLPITPFSVW